MLKLGSITPPTKIVFEIRVVMKLGDIVMEVIVKFAMMSL